MELEEALAKIESLESEIEDLESEVEDLKEEIESIKKELEEAQEERNDFERERDEFEEAQNEALQKLEDYNSLIDFRDSLSVGDLVEFEELIKEFQKKSIGRIGPNVL